MKMIWNRREVFVGASYNKFCDAKNILYFNKIKYIYRSVNHETSNCFGSSRGHSGSFGIRNDYLYTYYLYVHKNDYDCAEKLLHKN